jgi:hypothetical protein
MLLFGSWSGADAWLRSTRKEHAERCVLAGLLTAGRRCERARTDANPALLSELIKGWSIADCLVALLRFKIFVGERPVVVTRPATKPKHDYESQM